MIKILFPQSALRTVDRTCDRSPPIPTQRNSGNCRNSRSVEQISDLDSRHPVASFIDAGNHHALHKDALSEQEDHQRQRQRHQRGRLDQVRQLGITPAEEGHTDR